MGNTGDQQYVMGHDHPEIKRLQQQHLWLRSDMPDLVLAPIDKKKPNQKVIDSGTADGIWISDESSQLPESTTYIGADIAPHLFPPNPPSHTKFITQSIKDAWPAEYHSAFDLVHQRLVLACCDEFEAKIAVQRLVELAKPGAWIQLMECDHSGAFSAEVAETHPALLQFGKLVISHLAKKGQCAQQGLHLKRYLTDAGALDVTEVILDIPVGASAADPTIGQVAANNLVEVAGKMQGDAQFVEQLKQELNNVGGTQRFHVVYGRRPA